MLTSTLACLQTIALFIFPSLPFALNTISWRSLEGVLKLKMMTILICASNSGSPRIVVSVPRWASTEISLKGAEMLLTLFCLICQSIINCWASESVILNWKLLRLKSAQNYQNWSLWKLKGCNCSYLSKKLNEYIWEQGNLGKRDDF